MYPECLEESIAQRRHSINIAGVNKIFLEYQPYIKYSLITYCWIKKLKVPTSIFYNYTIPKSDSIETMTNSFFLMHSQGVCCKYLLRIGSEEE